MVDSSEWSAPASALQLSQQQGNLLPIGPRSSPPTGKNMILNLFLEISNIGSNQFKEPPLPGKRCLLPDFLFRFPPAISNQTAKPQLWHYQGVAWVYLGYLWKRTKNPFLILTHQRILVSWISACWPPHQRNVQQVDRLAVGHRQTPNRSPMETGQNLSSQKKSEKIKRIRWFLSGSVESLKSSCSDDVPPAMEGDDAHVGGSRGLARHHRDQLLIRELCPPSAFSLRVLHEQQLHRILVAENNERTIVWF